MKVRNLLKSDKGIMILLYVVFALISVFYGIHLSIPLVIDEVGTVANTAFLAGDDWSICVQSMGGFYYKYGLSVLYLPIYLIFKSNPFYMYKTMMAMHMLLISFIPVIAYFICRKHLNIESKIKSLLFAIVGGGISSMWLYSLYSRADVMLILLPWILLLILLELYKASEEKLKNKRIVYSILLAVASVYAYMSHSRGIILLIAVFMTVCTICFVFRKKIISWIPYIAVSGVLLVIDKFVSRYVKSGVYGEYGTRRASLENFDMDTFLKIFTPKGFLFEVKTCIGWLFNLLASSYGLVAIGSIAAAIIIVMMLRKKEVVNMYETIFAVFALLCVLGTFFMGALYFFPHVYKLFMGIEVDRADRVMYGRYTVGAVGPICMLAIYTLVNKHGIIFKLKAKIITVIGYILVLGAFVWKVGPYLNNIPATNSRYFLSLTAFLNIIDSQTNAAFPDLTTAMLKIGLVSLGVLLLILILTSTKNVKTRMAACALIFAVSFVNFNYVFYHVRNDRDDLVATRVNQVVTYINNIEGISNVAEQYPCMYRDDSATLLKCYQFTFPEFNVGKLKYFKDYNQSEFLMLCHKKNINEAITNCDNMIGKGEYYKFNGFDYDHATRDVVIIRGAALADKIEKLGNEITQIEVE